MRRYRFGRIAALIALGYLAAVAVLGAFALTSDRGDLLWKVVTRDIGMGWFFGRGKDTFTVLWGLTLVLILIGALQAWAPWQVLRGRARGELTHRGRKVGLLRLAPASAWPPACRSGGSGRRRAPCPGTRDRARPRAAQPRPNMVRRTRFDLGRRNVQW